MQMNTLIDTKIVPIYYPITVYPRSSTATYGHCIPSHPPAAPNTTLSRTSTMLDPTQLMVAPVVGIVGANPATYLIAAANRNNLMSPPHNNETYSLMESFRTMLDGYCCGGGHDQHSQDNILTNRPTNYSCRFHHRHSNSINSINSINNSRNCCDRNEDILLNSLPNQLTSFLGEESNDEKSMNPSLHKAGNTTNDHHHSQQCETLIKNPNSVSKRKMVPPKKLKKQKDIKHGILFKMKPLFTNANSLKSSILVYNLKNVHQKDTTKFCISCGSIDTPLWRDVPQIVKAKYNNQYQHSTISTNTTSKYNTNNKTPALCNACGIRWKKYSTKCTLCDHIPKKYQRNLRYCYKCNQPSIQKYYFH